MQLAWLMGCAVLATSTFAMAQPAPSADTKKETTRKPAKSRVVRFKTSDGITIVANYYPPIVRIEKKSPVAILVHMHPADRQSWKPLVPGLRKAGFAVLAYDIRGNGESIEPKDRKLKTLYKTGNPEFFKNAWKDAAAAKKWLGKQPECDTSRIAIIGASIGCSISLHYGSLDEAVKAVVCLSPGTKYFDVDSRKHIKDCGKRAILLLSPRTEYPPVEKLIKASGNLAKGTMYPGGNERHGTYMFDAEYGEKVKKQIVEFVRKAVFTKKGNALSGGTPSNDPPNAKP